jgi:hypothetical protein
LHIGCEPLEFAIFAGTTVLFRKAHSFAVLPFASDKQPAIAGHQPDKLTEHGDSLEVAAQGRAAKCKDLDQRAIPIVEFVDCRLFVRNREEPLIGSQRQPGNFPQLFRQLPLLKRCTVGGRSVFDIERSAFGSGSCES